ncbi:MAG: sensor histidine kinase [Lachnospiraceae bacterium]|nr:sensor histidine kinase [Lachnospiraceae bacterium]MDY5742707.1 sensor histidine kinase [Lachnospiraceae bacterium]
MNPRLRFSLLRRALPSWLRDRRCWLLCSLPLLLLTASLDYFFHNITDFVSYIILLQSLLLIGCLLIDLILYCRRIYQIYDSITAVKLGGHSKQPAELDCQLLLSALDEQTAALRKATEVVSETKSRRLDYYTVWGHQIKTPIAAASLLVESLPESEARQQLEGELFKIRQYAEHVLHYLRMESFHQDLQPRCFTVEHTVNELVKKYALFFIRNRINLELHVDSSWTVVSDEKWLSILIEQLLANALKYTAPGGTIMIYRLGQQLVVGDTGIGIRAADLPLIFERSFTGFNGHEKYTSSGLGLYLAKMIADRLHVNIRISSQPGQGSLFSLTLPDEPFSPKE